MTSITFLTQRIPYVPCLVACGSFTKGLAELRVSCFARECGARCVEQVRKADGTSETSDILDKAKLVELLDSVFGLTLPAAVTEFEGFDRYLKQPVATL